MSFTRSDLKDLDKIWEEARGQSSSEVGEVPEGKYQAKIKSMKLDKSSGGRPQCVCVYKIVGGDEKSVGKELTIYEGLETVQNMSFFAKKLKRLKLPAPESFEDVPALAERAVGAVVDIQVKYKDDFVNVYINKLVSPGTGAAGEEEDAKKPTRKASEDEEPRSKVKEKPEDEDEDKDKDEDGDDSGDGDKDEKDKEDDEDEEKPPKKKEEDDEDDDDDDDGEKPAARNYASQAEVDRMPTKGMLKLLSEFGIKGKDEKSEKALRRVCKALVAVMEDDDYDAPEEDLSLTAKWLGLEPKTGKKALLRQVIGKLSE